MFQKQRLEFTQKVWLKDKQLQEAGFDITDYDVVQLHTAFTNKIEQVDSVGDLLLAEALMTKRLYH
ncbi:hypothetical protein, partial [Streptococcus pneumoniae]|uniref:hypothetical protein n=1 Tax=Streptococcus pneumoniae TaxID=1313 RepID=UPI001955012F